MSKPLIPAALRKEYTALEAEYDAAWAVPDGANPDYAVVAGLQKRMADMYDQLSKAACGDALIWLAMTRAGAAMRTRAETSRAIAEQLGGTR